jgi:hypothetical protein
MSKLERYNGALGRLSERKLASLTEAREPRRVLDDFWDSVTAYCLARGYWKHAKRSQRIEASANITPAFGPRFAFEKPDDLVRVYLISASEGMEPGFSYLDENGVWYADADTIYVTYISNDPAFGMDLSRWGAMFAEYVEARLALKGGPRVTNNKADLDVLIAEEKRAMNVALGVDAMEGPPAVPPLNSWVRARGGGGNRARWDGSWSS